MHRVAPDSESARADVRAAAGDRPAGLVVRPLTVADAEQIATWRYEGQWRTYDSRPEDGLLSTEAGYQAVADPATGALVGYVCTGAEARVPGLAEKEGVVDVGAGMRPDLVGGRIGSEFGAAVLGYLAAHAGTGDFRLRAVVLDWNERSLRLCARLGFRRMGTHSCEQDGRQNTYFLLETEPQA
ncbi:MAG TPA: GNAT family N-acetyltransferase [Streptosporangiaceae bacterium]|nr:GNAT family N-acetyltransferase [Streptosporangiaceae bacterium]